MRSFIASAVLLALAALPVSFAAPAPQRNSIQPPFGGSNGRTGSLLPQITGCPIKLLPTLPANQTRLAVPAGEVTEFVGLGVGSQNYTCGAAGTYTPLGAVATLFDVSCAVGTPIFKLLPDMAFKAGASTSKVKTCLTGALTKAPFQLGTHVFQFNAAGARVPTFDFTSSQKKSAFVVAAKKDGIPAPNTATDVDLLQLVRTDGTIGKSVYRLDTRGGQPPKTCTTGTSPDVQIPYVAMYWFTK